MEIDPEVKKILDMKLVNGEITEEAYKERLLFLGNAGGIEIEKKNACNKKAVLEQDKPIEQKHSGLGIASFMISISVIILLFFMNQVFAPVLFASVLRDKSKHDLSSIFFFLMLIMDTLALYIGIKGILQKERKKVFAILGTTFSSTMMIGGIFLFLFLFWEKF